MVRLKPKLKPKLVRPMPKLKGDAAKRWSAAFADYLRSECRLADNTVLAYARDLRRFRGWLGRYVSRSAETAYGG